MDSAGARGHCGRRGGHRVDPGVVLIVTDCLLRVDQSLMNDLLFIHDRHRWTWTEWCILRLSCGAMKGCTDIVHLSALLRALSIG